MLDDKSIELFSSRDKLREHLIELGKNYLGVDTLDFAKESYLSYLINILSVLASNLMYYNTSVYREFFLTKAIHKESVINLATMLGYNPSMANPAGCKVFLELDGSVLNTTNSTLELVLHGLSESGDIDLVYKVKTKNDITFSLNDTLIITMMKDLSETNSKDKITIGTASTNNYLIFVKKQTSSGTESVPFRVYDNKLQIFADFTQVSKNEESFTVPRMKPYEFYTLNLNLKNLGYLADVDVKVKTEFTSTYEIWENYPTLYLIPSSRKGYVFKQTEDGIKILFGNGIVGMQPPQSSTVVINTTMTVGSEGNIIAGSISNGDNILYNVTDTYGNVVSREIKPYVLNKTAASGGVNAETIDDIRSNAINSVSTNQRLVSSKDFSNMDLIVPALPFKHIIHVLKRSDLTGNYINLFTDLIFMDEIVPTKNAVILMDETEFSTGSNIIDSLTEKTIENETDTAYITMFDMNILKYIRENTTPYYLAKYFYTIKESTKSAIISNAISYSSIYYDDLVVIRPTNIEFSVIEELENSVLTKKLQVELYIINMAEGQYGRSFGYEPYLWLDVGGDFVGQGIVERVYIQEEDYENPKFTFKVDLDDVNLGERNISFEIRRDLVYEINDTSVADLIPPTDSSDYYQYYYYVNKLDVNSSVLPNGVSLSNSYTNITIREDLSDIMQSRVIQDSTTVKIYDVPMVNKDYYYMLSETEKSNFEFDVYQNIMNFDIEEYKMLTDFVNLKLSTTSGTAINMKYNLETKDSVNDVYNITTDHTSFNSDYTSHLEGYRIAFLGTDPTNPWYTDSTTARNDGAWISHRGTGGWVFQSMSPNDIFDLSSDSTSVYDGKYLYTGSEIKKPEYEIPLTVSMSIIREETYSGTDDAIVTNIKNNLIDELSPNFGYDKPIYKSEITKVVQSTAGVKSCTITEPKHDIFFTYNPFVDMSPAQLLDYSPELIYFSSENISVEVRRDR